MLDAPGFWPSVVTLAAILWIGSQITRDIRDRKRAAGLAITAAVGYLAYALAMRRREAYDGLSLLFFAAVVGAFALGAAWIVMPGVNAIVQPLVNAIEAARRERRVQVEEHRRERERRRREKEAKREWQRSALLRERQRLEAEERYRAAEDARHRRDRARSECEILYALYHPEINSRFSREHLERFFRMYMTEQHSVEEVERRAGELQRIITEHRKAVKPIQQERTIEEIVAWYNATKRQIEGMDVEKHFRESLKAQLEEKFAEDTENAFRKANA